MCRHNSAKPISFFGDDDDDDFFSFLFDGAIFFFVSKEAYATVTAVLFFQPKRQPSLSSSSLSSVREYYYLYDLLLYVYVCIYIVCDDDKNDAFFLSLLFLLTKSLETFTFCTTQSVEEDKKGPPQKDTDFHWRVRVVSKRKSYVSSFRCKNYYEYVRNKCRFFFFSYNGYKTLY